MITTFDTTTTPLGLVLGEWSYDLDDGVPCLVRRLRRGDMTIGGRHLVAAVIQKGPEVGSYLSRVYHHSSVPGGPIFANTQPLYRLGFNIGSLNEAADFVDSTLSTLGYLFSPRRGNYPDIGLDLVHVYDEVSR